ncbi:MAG: DUF4251 domain-containing protein [Bacteroidales bacterium]
MKTSFFIVLTMLFALTCTQGYAQKTRKEERSQKEILAARAVADIVREKKIIAIINKATPSGERMRSIDDYPFKLVNDSLSCNLPFFGSSSGALWGSDNLTIQASGYKISLLNGKFNLDNHTYVLTFEFNTVNSESMKCTLTIFLNTKVNILIEGSRTTMSYDGFLDIDAIKAFFY